ncbi:MAG: hypothetical protein JSV33_09145 [bacterium]|nr:MAG: hypothetical protein JSV33_09145 [bacterium]
MRKVAFFVLLFIANNALSQGVTPGEWGLQAFRIEDETLGAINYYVTEDGIDKSKPLLFVAMGSGGLPSMIYVKAGDSSTQLGVLPADFITRFSDRFHVAYMAMPGTPFCDTVTVDEINPIEILEGYKPSEEYVLRCDLNWRVQASSLVIDALYNTLPVAGDKIVAMGISEGGRIVPELAVVNEKITHVVVMLSGGINHFFDSIINNRIDAAHGTISHQKAQHNIDSLFSVYKDIYNHPNSTDKWWYGHPYKRWASFCTDIPLEDLVKLNIPILLVSGSIDRNAPVLQSDYIKLEFLRLKKMNLTYHVLPGVNHWLMETVEEDEKEKMISHRDEAMEMVVNWIESN